MVVFPSCVRFSDSSHDKPRIFILFFFPIDRDDAQQALYIDMYINISLSDVWIVVPYYPASLLLFVFFPVLCFWRGLAQPTGVTSNEILSMMMMKRKLFFFCWGSLYKESGRKTQNFVRPTTCQGPKNPYTLDIASRFFTFYFSFSSTVWNPFADSI